MGEGNMHVHEIPFYVWVINIPGVHHNYDPLKQGKSQYALHCVDPLMYEQSPVFQDSHKHHMFC